MTTEISDNQYNELCASTQKLFGLNNVNDAALIVNFALNFRDWLAAQYDDQTGGEYVESQDSGFAEGEFDGGFDGGADDFGGEQVFDGGDGAEFGDADFGGDGDMVFDDNGFDGGDGTDFGGDEFGGEGDFGGDDFGGDDMQFGVGEDDGFSFDEAPAPAPARQAARPAARPAAPAPAQNSRGGAARPAAPAPARQAARPAAPAPAPAQNSRGGSSAGRAAPAPAQNSRGAAPAGDQYDAMKNGDLVKEAQDRGLAAYAKEIKGDAATKRAGFLDLLRKVDKKIATGVAKYSVEQLEAQSKKAGLDVKYGRGRATDERKKAMHIEALIAAGVIKL